MKQAGCQGIIYWGLAGWNPRGEMFRTDFDVFPPAIQRAIPVLRERFAEAGMTLGLATRPRQLTVRGTWGAGLDLRREPGGRQHLESQILIRFQRAIDQGFTLFYLDTFGDSFPKMSW